MVHQPHPEESIRWISLESQHRNQYHQMQSHRQIRWLLELCKKYTGGEVYQVENMIGL